MFITKYLSKINQKSEIAEMASKVKKDENPSFYNYGMTLRHKPLTFLPEISGPVRNRPYEAVLES